LLGKKAKLESKIEFVIQETDQDMKENQEKLKAVESLPRSVFSKVKKVFAEQVTQLGGLIRSEYVEAGNGLQLKRAKVYD